MIICFIASFFYLLPLISLLYLPLCSGTLTTFIKKTFSYSCIPSFLYAFLTIFFSMILMGICGFLFIGFLSYECHYYVSRSFFYSILQLTGLLTLLAIIQITILKYLLKDKRINKLIILSNGFTGLIILVGYYVLFILHNT